MVEVLYDMTCPHCYAITLVDVLKHFSRGKGMRIIGRIKTDVSEVKRLTMHIIQRQSELCLRFLNSLVDFYYHLQVVLYIASSKT